MKTATYLKYSWGHASLLVRKMGGFWGAGSQVAYQQKWCSPTGQQAGRQPGNRENATWSAGLQSRAPAKTHQKAARPLHGAVGKLQEAVKRSAHLGPRRCADPKTGRAGRRPRVRGLAAARAAEAPAKAQENQNGTARAGGVQEIGPRCADQAAHGCADPCAHLASCAQILPRTWPAARRSFCAPGQCADWGAEYSTQRCAE